MRRRTPEKVAEAAAASSSLPSETTTASSVIQRIMGSPSTVSSARGAPTASSKAAVEKRSLLEIESGEQDDESKSTKPWDPMHSYQGRRRTTMMTICTIVSFVIVMVFLGHSIRNTPGGARSFFGISSDARRLAIATWNIAAINNNPFEYWITYKENPAYEKLMVDIEKFLEEPTEATDVLVPQVFTQAMFDKLDERLTGTAGWKSVKTYWENDFSKRRILTDFMKDPLLGSKRLASMPDRVTNTINTADGKQVYRPTVINMFEGDLSTQELWWATWEKFIFDDKLKIKLETGIEEKIPYQMLQPIKKAKYPDITEEEEADSLPLQTMCGAIFDAILVHMMNTVAESPASWQSLKKTMVEHLNKQKIPHTLEILQDKYADSDIITMQEVSSSFIDEARSGPLGRVFHIYAPADMDAVRDQNSVVCLNKSTFPKGKIKEITPQVSAAFPEGVKVPVAPGDILALTTENSAGVPFVIASFHGDTNGLATKPVVNAIVKAMKDDASLANHKLIFGLDANTYEHATPGKQQDVLDFATDYVAQGLSSCWGDAPNPSNYTTYNARTYLQPQLNKACRQSEKREKGDVNPKDFILFGKQDFTVIQTLKDNTGEKQYVEDMAFPTLQFPSDHGILSTVIEMVADENVN